MLDRQYCYIYDDEYDDNDQANYNNHHDNDWADYNARADRLATGAALRAD